MAAGSSAYSKGRGQSGALESALDRKMQSVSNTMESIQGLSAWCLDNRKHHGTVVHYWMKWMRRSGVPHRLNLFYLANDVIQNCKRKNAIIYRESFAEVLPEAATLVKDPSISKSIERIFKIWEERGVYPEETIAAFKGTLSTYRSQHRPNATRVLPRYQPDSFTKADTGWGKRERSKNVRTKVAEKVAEEETVNPKAVLKSKIVAEFRPQSLIEELLAYKCSVDQIDLKEKQLSTMRVDVGSSETLKRLKDKAGGKKFSKDFEEANTKLEEFVTSLEKQVKAGPAVTEALENAGVFYEAQYKEVKVVANAYTTFANRVSNLKKKLDQLKATLPDPEESPVPSPTMDAPSPTGSDSPFPGMELEDSLSPLIEAHKAVPAKPTTDNKETVKENHDKPLSVPRAEPVKVPRAEPVESPRAETVSVKPTEPAAGHHDQPAAVRDQPAAVRDQPAAVRDQPAAVRDQPAAVRDQPAAVRDQPAAVRDQPAPSLRADPVAGQRDKPGAGHHSEPVAGQSDKPATSRHSEPAAGQRDKPAAGSRDKPASVHRAESDASQHDKSATVHLSEQAAVHRVEPAMDYCNEPAADNREVEDMELSDVDEDSAEIIVEDGTEEKQVVSTSSLTVTDNSLNVAPSASTAPLPATLRPESLPPPSPPPDSPPVSSPEYLSSPSPPVPTPPTPPTPGTATQSVPTPVTPGRSISAAAVASSASLPLPNLANVDLAKISSILSSLTSVMKHTGVSPGARPSPGTPTTPTSAGFKNPVQSSTPTSHVPLSNILSKVEITPESILSVLSKTQAPSTTSLQGLALFQNVPGNTASSTGGASLSSSTSPANTTVSSIKDRSGSSNGQPFNPKTLGFSPNSSTSEVSSTSVSKTSMGHSSGLSSSSFKPSVNSLEFSNLPLSSTETSMSESSEASKAKVESESSSPTSLEMKIHNFLKGNPGFSGLDLNIPILGNLGPANTASESQSSDFHRGPTSTSMDNVDGTPVRDERGGTPTQDEMMDKPTSSNVDTMSLLSKIMSPGSSSTPSSTRSPPQSRDEDYRDLSNSLTSYRSFSLGGGSSPTAYRPSSDTMEQPSSLMDSPPEHFYPDTSFQEDEDYRDYEYSGPPPPTTMNLEKKPAKSILKSTKLLDSEGYQPIQTSYSHRTQEFGMQSAFPPSLRSILDQGDSCSQLSSIPELYGNYSIGGNEAGSDESPSPSNKDIFFTPDSNQSSLSQSLLNSVLPQTQFPDSPHSVLPRHFSTHATSTGLPPVSSVEGSLVSSISATSTMEFKNMLKNASRKSSEEQQFVETSKSNSKEGANLLSQTGKSSEDQQQLQEEHYRIETRVSSSCLDLPDSTEEKGAPIQTLGYHTSTRLSGEPIQTVESIRVLGKGSRGPERDGGRVDWFERSSTGSSFDNVPSSELEQPTLGGNSGVAAFNTQYKEHAQQYQDNVNNFRTNNFNPAFEHHRPPPIVPLFEKDLRILREQVGPPPGPSVDHGGLFPRDHPIPSHMPLMDPNLFSKETTAPLPMPHAAPPLPVEHGCPFPVPPPLPPPLPVDHGGMQFPAPPPPPPPPPLEHGGLPFSPPPLLDRGAVQFPKDHGAVHHGPMKEHYNLNQGPPRDHLALPHRDHNGPPRTRENLGPPPRSREHHGPPLGGYPRPLLGPQRRDNLNQSGMMMRNPRQDFRPRDPFHSLKRPQPPFQRGPPFFAPKRPFYPPRY